MHRILKISILVLLLSSCATGRLQLTANPEGSEISVTNERGEIRSLGKTPLDLEMQQIFSSSSAFAQIIVSKDGYFSQTVLLPRTSMPSSHAMSLSLEAKPIIKPPVELPTPPIGDKIDQCEQLSKSSMNKLGKGIAVAQATILKREYEVAMVRVASLISEYPFISVLYDLQGNIQFMQKSYTDALKSYERSLELDPENIETAIVVRRLRAQIGKGK